MVNAAHDAPKDGRDDTDRGYDTEDRFKIVARGSWFIHKPEHDRRYDLVLEHKATGEFRRVQVKSRWLINKKYLDRKIWMAFPDRVEAAWYLAPHDCMVNTASPKLLASASWKTVGEYHADPMTKVMRAALSAYRL